VPLRVYPPPAVKEEVLEAVSAFPITNEPVAGVMEGETDGVVEPPEELPVEVSAPAVVAPLISKMETDPIAVLPNNAVIVSAPELTAVVYQM